MPVKIYESLEALPASYDALFEEAGRRDFFQSRAWFANLIATTFEPDEKPRLYGLEDVDGVPQALLVTRWRERKWLGLFTKRELRSCTGMYSVSYAPICRGDPAQNTDIAEPLMRAIIEDRTWDTVQFDCMDKDSPHFEAFAQAFRRNGFWVQTYLHFGTWFERVAGETFACYMAKRPSKLRNTLDRKRKKLDVLDGIHFQVISASDDLELGIKAYAEAHAASWKRPEPYSNMTEGLIRAAAAEGALRLGVLWIADQPVAAQIWIVAGGNATIFKLAHRKDRRALSPGSLLTRYTIQWILDNDQPEQIDFGRGDEVYKALWLNQRNQRAGLVSANPNTDLGRMAAFRLLLSSYRRRLTPLLLIGHKAKQQH